jgi:hypothetical protein
MSIGTRMRCRIPLSAMRAGNAVKSAREQLTLIRIFEELRGAAMTQVTTLFGVTSGGGTKSVGSRRLQPMSH